MIVGLSEKGYSEHKKGKMLGWNRTTIIKFKEV